MCLFIIIVYIMFLKSHFSLAASPTLLCNVICHESVSCSSPIHYKRSPSSRTHYLDSIHLSLIIKPSAEPYDHRHVLLTHHFARLFTHLPDCLFPHLSSLCLLSGVGTSYNISLKPAWNPALLAPWIFPVYAYRDFGFPLQGGLICVYFLLY